MSRETKYEHMIYEMKPKSMMRIKLEFLGFMTFDITILKHHGRERENQAQREAYAI